MNATVSTDEDRTSAAISTFIFHALLIGLMLIPFMSEQIEPEQPVIVVDWGGGGQDAALGAPDEGQGNDPAPQGAPAQPEPIAKVEPTPDPPARSEPTPSKPKPTEKPKVKVPEKTATTSDPNAASVRKQKEEAKRQKEAEDKQRREEANRAANEKRQQEIEAQKERDRIAAEKKRQKEEYDRKKNQMGGSFGSGSGSGSGNTGTSGNQGTPTGSGSNPFGQTSGSGGGTGGGSGTGAGTSVGGGLGNRKVTGRPSVVDNSQEVGTVVINVCVDGDGKVISTDFSLKGSTTQNGQLVNTAKKAAQKFSFESSPSPKQCGTISFVFKLK